MTALGALQDVGHDGVMSDHQDPQARIGMPERNAAVNALSGHLSAGRLDESEYRIRTERVWAAQTRAELDEVFTDLPANPPAPAEPATPSTPVLQPYQPPAGADRPIDRQMMHEPAKRTPPGQVQRLLAISGGLATIIFLALGFAFGAWAWAWIVFLIPGLVRGYYGIQGDDKDGC